MTRPDTDFEIVADTTSKILIWFAGHGAARGSELELAEISWLVAGAIQRALVGSDRAETCGDPAILCNCGYPLTYGVVHSVNEMCWVPYAEGGETRPYRGIESMNRPDLRVPVANDKETSDDRPWSPEQVRQAVWRLIDQTAGKP